MTSIDISILERVKYGKCGGWDSQLKSYQQLSIRRVKRTNRVQNCFWTTKQRAIAYSVEHWAHKTAETCLSKPMRSCSTVCVIFKMDAPIQGWPKKTSVLDDQLRKLRLFIASLRKNWTCEEYALSSSEQKTYRVLFAYELLERLEIDFLDNVTIADEA